MSSDTMFTPAIIAKQEEAAWAEYEAAKQADTQDPATIVMQEVVAWDDYCANQRADAFPDDDSFMEEDDEGLTSLSGFSRFQVTNIGPDHLYPQGKPGYTTKERRYNPRTKKSDEGKVHGKPRGRSYVQMKKTGQPVTVEESLEVFYISLLDKFFHFFFPFSSAPMVVILIEEQN